MLSKTILLHCKIFKTELRFFISFLEVVNSSFDKNIMKNLKGIIRNLAVIKFLSIQSRDYKNSEIKAAFDATNKFLLNHDLLLEERIEVTNIVTEWVEKLLYIREHEEEAQERRTQITNLISKLDEIKEILQ
ncbi:MAG: hypothetical protein KME25_33440 [Symplocastrum torsivum CPER-KK1]|jgi:hypothetical protein|uniref:Uncharacterized protein n=1 Tax=Symplocastrum torsivum CPER-KK1 TaxID=450513 RepID=A0A951PSE9_9CYAN|nr:hypothetical protein [Symplocastrum torsivum CPER-KK1]